jgi:acetylornithine/succinyldiaminopimelate/putrescine aminotransferase
MVLGKGMSSAVIPLSSATYRRHLQSFFDADAFCHLSSGGGSDLACHVALAMLNTVSRPEFLQHVRMMGQRFEEGLGSLRDRHRDVFRGWNRRGLMMGLVFAGEECGPRMSRALSRNGVIAVFSGFNRHIVQLMPSLVIQPAEVDEVVEALDRAMTEVERDLGR